MAPNVPTNSNQTQQGTTQNNTQAPQPVQANQGYQVPQTAQVQSQIPQVVQTPQAGQAAQAPQAAAQAPQLGQIPQPAQIAQGYQASQGAAAYQASDQADAQSQQAGFIPAFTPGQGASRAARNAYGKQTKAAQFDRENMTYAAQGKRKRRKRIITTVVCVLLAALVGVGVAAAVWYTNINNELTKGSKTDDELNAIEEQLTATPTKTFDEPFYMMLIGSDAREDSDEEGQRSDTNIVVRIDPTTNTVTLISIPRDTMIELDDYGVVKFNAAYAYDGTAGAIREAKKLLGVNIEHYAEVDFNELEALVDACGGVDLTVEERIDDYDADNWSKEEFHHIVLEEGYQHLTGEQALVFARSRAYTDGDFTRTKNQRALIEALANKVLNLPATELPGVVEAAAKSVTTDLSISDIVALAQQFADSDTNISAASSKNASSAASTDATSTDSTTSDTDSTTATDEATTSTSSNSSTSSSALSGLTMYSAMVPSATTYVDGVSYVINDPDATARMMKLVEAGKDPSTVESTTDAATLIAKYYSDMLGNYSVISDTADGMSGNVTYGNGAAQGGPGSMNSTATGSGADTTDSYGYGQTSSSYTDDATDSYGTNSYGPSSTYDDSDDDSDYSYSGGSGSGGGGGYGYGGGSGDEYSGSSYSYSGSGYTDDDE